MLEQLESIIPKYDILAQISTITQVSEFLVSASQQVQNGKSNTAAWQ